MIPKVALLTLLGLIANHVFAQESDEDVAKKLNNPVANLISVPFQSNWDFRGGLMHNGTQYKLNFQPVIPIGLGDHWTLILRTIIPYIDQRDELETPLPAFPGVPDSLLDGVPKGQRNAAISTAEKEYYDIERGRPVDVHQDGLGDTLQSFFFSPTAGGPFGTIIGAGPAFSYPTATDDVLGTQKWSAGPTLVMLKQTGGWTYGMLSNQIWSFAGNDKTAYVDASFLQPFINYTTKASTTFGVDAESTYDWRAGQWTVPLNFTIGQVVRIGKIPVSFTVGGRYYADGPAGAPDWGVRFVVTPVFPTGGGHAAQIQPATK
jgi:hypothetical protein